MTTPERPKRTRAIDAPQRERKTLFAKFRVVGRVADEVPAVVHYRGTAPFVTTSVGRAFHVYDGESLNLVAVGEDAPKGARVLACAAGGDRTAVATDAHQIVLYVRGAIVRTVDVPTSDMGSAVQMLVLGSSDDVLLVLCERGMLVFALPSMEETCRMSFERSAPATAVEHPQTLLNKVVVGFADGCAELWNTASGRRVHVFACVSASAMRPCDAPLRGITAVVPSHVVDVVAFCCADGRVVVADVRRDTVLFVLEHSSAPTAASFRTDESVPPQLAVALHSGSVALWDLESRTLLASWDAHAAPVSAALFLRGRPELLTSAGDNALRVWSIEAAPGAARASVLRSRAGHSGGGPRRIRFVAATHTADGDGDALLTAGDDRALRILSLVKDSQSVEVSQGSIARGARLSGLSAAELRLDPVASFAVHATREPRWDNVVTAHVRSAAAHTWRADHGRIGSHTLRTRDGAHVSAVAMSACGHFALVATVSGAVDVFNVQSGAHRRHFAPGSGLFDVVAGASGDGGDGSDRLVACVAVDACNRYVAVVHAGGVLRLLGFADGALLASIDLGGRVESAVYHPETELLAAAVACGNGTRAIVVVDTETKVVGRRMLVEGACVSDLAFSADSRWVLAACADNAVRTWDIPSGRLIDRLDLPDAPLSLALSPEMDVLAVSLAGDVGVHLWTNASLYRAVDVLSEVAADAVFTLSQECIEDGVARLSSQPRAKWTTLYRLDTVRDRSRPAEPPSGALKTPFFLDALLSTKRSADSVGVETAAEPAAATPATANMEHAPAFERMLDDPNTSDDALLDALAAQSPAQIDFELQCLVQAGEEPNTARLCRLLSAVLSRLRRVHSVDMAAALLVRVMRAHRDVIAGDSVSRALLLDASAALDAAWAPLENDLHATICLSAFARDAM